MEHFYGSWSLMSEKVQWLKFLAMKIISLESLYILYSKNVSPMFFNSRIRTIKLFILSITLKR